jgi:hypothetical protein
MRTISKLTVIACALFVPSALVAETFKCTDANGKVTYSERKCSDLGLKDAGEVKDQIQTAPAYRPAPRIEGARNPPPSPASAPAAQAPAPEPPPAQPSEAPPRRCFTVQTAKGTATRCNDAPPDPDAPPDKP